MTEWEPCAGREWDIFDADGRLTAHLTSPGNFEITDLGEQFILGAHTDALGVQTARMYRVLHGQRGQAYRLK